MEHSGWENRKTSRRDRVMSWTHRVRCQTVKLPVRRQIRRQQLPDVWRGQSLNSQKTQILDNWRPITLLNNDYKILTHIFSNRLKEGLSQIISDTQSGFMKGRSIHNNIRLVLDLIEYSDYISDDGFILFLDFYKAFDMVEHPFIFKALELCSFGENFRNIIKCFYHNTNS